LLVFASLSPIVVRCRYYCRHLLNPSIAKPCSRSVQFQMQQARSLDAHFPSRSTFCRHQGQREGRNLECELQGHARCRSSSLTRRCHQYLPTRHLPRHYTMSALYPPPFDVTSASPVDFQLLPGPSRCRCSSYYVNDDVRDSSRTNHRSSTADVGEITSSVEPDVIYSATPTHLTTQYSSLRY